MKHPSINRPKITRTYPKIRTRSVAQPPARLPEFFAPNFGSGVDRAALVLDDLLPSAYLDYRRRLTPEGGIAITYKDHDTRFRILLRRVALWLAATGVEFWYLAYHAPLDNWPLRFGFLILCAVLNWLIVRRPVEVQRTVEIRSDCMILEGRDIFWLRNMDAGWPEFTPAEDGTLTLTGIYGTRWVEFLTARRFDERDRGPEVLAAHLAEAMKQLWDQPQD